MLDWVGIKIHIKSTLLT